MVHSLSKRETKEENKRDSKDTSPHSTIRDCKENKGKNTNHSCKQLLRFLQSYCPELACDNYLQWNTDPEKESRGKTSDGSAAADYHSPSNLPGQQITLVTLER